jgi:hypothetical protein
LRSSTRCQLLTVFILRLSGGVAHFSRC